MGCTTQRQIYRNQDQKDQKEQKKTDPEYKNECDDVNQKIVQKRQKKYQKLKTDEMNIKNEKKKSPTSTNLFKQFAQDYGEQEIIQIHQRQKIKTNQYFSSTKYQQNKEQTIKNLEKHDSRTTQQRYNKNKGIKDYQRIQKSNIQQTHSNLQKNHI